MLIYKEKVEKEALIQERQVITTIDVKKTKKDCLDQVYFNDRYKKDRRAFEKAMLNYASVRNVHLEHISLAKSCIELKHSYTRPIHFGPYHNAPGHTSLNEKKSQDGERRGFWAHDHEMDIASCIPNEKWW